ncbi:MAG: DUF4058 family protein [Gemmataceae bacterium]|nr:DUF4058 family protein [Gemmataceae bacterium]
MPSPLPGMDPFLEDAELFPDLHNSLITYLRESLNATLPSPYYAATASRTEAETPDVIPVFVDEVQESFLEIFTKKGKERLVTSIELLSLSNKTPRDKGRRKYLKKQQTLLRKKVHLVEIDLLRGGKHVTAVPRALAEAKAGPFDYHVCVRRFDKPEEFHVYAWSLGERLPIFSLPLLPGDGSVPVDLQQLFDRAYDTGPYRFQVDYRQKPPPPPLTAEQARWLKSALREKAS